MASVLGYQSWLPSSDPKLKEGECMRSILNQGLWHGVLWEPQDETVLNIDEKNILKDCIDVLPKRRGCGLRQSAPLETTQYNHLISLKYLSCV